MLCVMVATMWVVCLCRSPVLTNNGKMCASKWAKPNTCMIIDIQPRQPSRCHRLEKKRPDGRTKNSPLFSATVRNTKKLKILDHEARFHGDHATATRDAYHRRLISHIYWRRRNIWFDVDKTARQLPNELILCTAASRVRQRIG